MAGMGMFPSAGDRNRRRPILIGKMTGLPEWNGSEPGQKPLAVNDLKVINGTKGPSSSKSQHPEFIGLMEVSFFSYRRPGDKVRPWRVVSAFMEIPPPLLSGQISQRAYVVLHKVDRDRERQPPVNRLIARRLKR